MALVALSPSVLQAADRDGHYVVKGAGTASCADYADAYDDKAGDFLLYLGWLGGYLTAVNEYRAETYDIAAWESVGLLAEYLDGHCERHPDQQLSNAARQLVKGLAPDRRQAQAEERVFQSGNIIVRVAPDVAERVDGRLRHLGLLAGDGDTLSVQEALGAFQQSQALPETRVPDQRTLHALLREGSAQDADR